MFTVNRKSLEYDILDLEKAEAFETALRTVNKKLESLDDATNLTWTQAVRIPCEAVAECFDSLFGEGTAFYVFDGKTNLELAMKAFGELVDGINAQKSRVEQIAKAAAKKYAGNREMRRAKK